MYFFIALLFFCMKAHGEQVIQGFDQSMCLEKSQDQWNNYTCSIATNPQKYQRNCLPRRWLPFNASSISELNSFGDIGQKVKGVMVLYHGFTACPDAYDAFSEYLVERGYLVYVPLLPGHGLELHYCDGKDSCTKDGSNPSGIPTKKEGYMKWTADIVNLIKNQLETLSPSIKHLDFKVHTLGLSVGGPLAVYSAELSNSPFDNVITVNPLWSSTAAILDFKVKRCSEMVDPESCILNALIKLYPSSNSSNLDDTKQETERHSGPFWKLCNAVGNILKKYRAWLAKETLGKLLSVDYDTTLLTLWNKMAEIGDNSFLMNLPILNTEYGWGEHCLDQIQQNRGGICSFRIKHLMALQSFNSYVAGNLQKVKRNIRYSDIQSDLDGGASDSVSLAITKYFKGSKCHFPLACSIEAIAEEFGTDNNICGASHSMFSRVEGLSTPPFKMFWEESLFSNILNAMESKDANFRIGVPVTKENMNDPSICLATNQSLGWGFKFEYLGLRYLTKSIKRYGY